MHSIALACLHMGSGKYFSNNEDFKHIIYKLRIQACFVFMVAVFELHTSTIDWNFPGGLDSQVEMSVRVWKNGVMVDTL